jgi:coenzyme F420-dependent glucose-6-phosphate dehydrogenase
VTLTIGYKASAEQFAPRELVEFSVLVEEVGLDSAWVSDHFQPWRHVGGHAPFSLAWMAAVGERTERITLGTSVLTPTYRYNPAVLAQAFATLGCLYPDRVVLGVGTGEALNERAVDADLHWPEFKERFARLRESIRLMRELWAGERVTFGLRRTVHAFVAAVIAVAGSVLAVEEQPPRRVHLLRHRRQPPVDEVKVMRAFVNRQAAR